MADEIRPRFHLTPPSGWMNDPNGPTFLDGRLHMFYQHDPAAPRWDRVHWGHAVTDDLVEWRHLPIALTPDDDGRDAFGCWSGSVVSAGDSAVMFYTGVVLEDAVRRASILRATSTDGLTTWTKDRSGPAVAGPPPGIAADAFRDPFVYRDGPVWAMLVGAGSTDGLGAVLRYRSADLVTWTYAGPFLSGGDLPRAAGADGPCWECPQLLRFPECDVLVVSVVDRSPGVRPSHVMAIVGRVAGDRFVADHAEPLSMGPDFYAPAVVRAPDGRQMLIGWIPEDPPAEGSDRDWAGSLTFPRVATVLSDGRLGLALAEEVASLRGAYSSTGARTIHAGEPVRADLAGRHIEVMLRLDPGDATEITVELIDGDDDASPDVRVGWQPTEGVLTVARRGIVSVAGRESQGTTTLAPTTDGRLHLRLLIDGSVLELEANGRTMSTVRLSAMHGPRLSLGVGAAGGRATLESMDTWVLGHDGDGMRTSQPVGAPSRDQ